ncbi:MAG: hypothetical protein OSA48_12190, partial [Akkermansiaceae bacterium]|nr:hypothetical protein [Akkermansiaceae bacterium]
MFQEEILGKPLQQGRLARLGLPDGRLIDRERIGEERITKHLLMMREHLSKTTMANGPLRSRALTSAFLFVCASGLMFGQGLEQGPPATGSTPYLTPAEELKLIELQDGYYLEL